MSFWSSHPKYAEPSIPSYLSEAEKTALVQSGRDFAIMRAIPQPNAEYQGNATPRWALIIRVSDDMQYDQDGREVYNERTLTLGMTDARDDMFNDMRSWLLAGNMPIRARLGWVAPGKGYNGFYTVEPVVDVSNEELDTAEVKADNYMDDDGDGEEIPF
jgi:hypothetical protein